MPVGQICVVPSHASEDPKEALMYRNNMSIKNEKKLYPYDWIPG